MFMPWLLNNSVFPWFSWTVFSLVQLNSSNFPVSLPVDMTVVFLRYEQCFSRDCSCFPGKISSAMEEVVIDNWQIILRL